MKPSDDQLRRLGSSLREIDPATLQTDPEEGSVRWFLGDNATEIFAWMHPGKPPHHLQLVFARVSVEWSQKGGLMTGTFAESSSTIGGRYDPYLMHLGQSADPDVCRAAMTLLSACAVDRALLQPLLDALKTAVNPVP